MKRLSATLTLALAMPLLALGQQPGTTSQQTGKQIDRPQRQATDKNSKVEQEILKMEEAMNQGFLQGPERLTTLFQRYLAEDYTAPSDSGAALVTKATTIASHQASTRTYLTRTLEDTKVHVYGDTAVVTGRVKGRVRTQGQSKEADRNLSFTSIWVKRNGQWQIVFRQGQLLDQSASARPNEPEKAEK